MTISAIDTGSVLYFSHDELPTVRPLTQEAVLPLIRRALAKARHPIPPAMEVKSFSSRQGVLFFVLPRLPEETAAARSAEGFSPESLLFPLSRLSFWSFPPKFSKESEIFPFFFVSLGRSARREKRRYAKAFPPFSWDDGAARPIFFSK